MKALSELKPNPNNPRTIKDEQYKKLVKSLKDFPEMTSVRPVIVNTEGIILGGNMRYKAAQEAGWKEIPVIEVDWSEAKQKEFIIKDNVSGGEWDWDMLANEWNEEELKDWGLEVNWDKPGLDEDYSQKLGEVIYEPKETNHKPSDLFEKNTTFDAAISAITDPTIRELCQLRAAQFTELHFAKVADYYAYQATPDEKALFERLALVLLDKDQLIEHGFSKILDSIEGATAGTDDED